MSQLITTTDISTIRPVFAQGASENIKRYNQLKKLFEKNKEYQVFAEPIPSGDQKIAWHTEFKGQAVPFAEVPDGQKENIKQRLKYQINMLYKAILQIVKHSNKNTKELYELLDSCIEIPDYQDIYIIRNPNGQNNFCIIRWGFTSDDFKAESGLISKLIPLKVATIPIKTIKQDKSIAPNETIFVEYNNQTIETQTDNDGMLYLEDVTLMTKFSIFQKDDTGKKIFEKNYVNDETPLFIFQIGEIIIEPPKQNVIIKTTDINNAPLTNIIINSIYDDFNTQNKSDTNSEIELGELPVGTVINCIQLINGEVANKQNFTIIQGQEIYIFKAEIPLTSGIMNLKLLDEKKRVIPNGQIKVFYGDKIITKTTDENGYISLSDIPYGADIKCQQIVNNVARHQQNITYTKETLNYTMLGSVPKPPAKYSNIEIQAVNRKKEPIKNLKITIENGNNTFNLYSNEEGKVLLNDINCDNKVIIKTEYQKKKVKKNFYCQSENEFHQIVLGKRRWLLWLWLLLLLLLILGALFWFFILPILQDIDRDKITVVDTVVVDTTHTIDTITPPQIEHKGIKIIILDKESNKPVANATVTIGYNSQSKTLQTNAKGEIIFEEVPEDKIEISVIINSTEYIEQLATFMFVKEKTFYLSEESIDVSEIVVDCGQRIASKGYGSTIRTINVKKSSGKLRVFYQMNSIPDELIVYSGKASGISDDKIIWKTNGYVKFMNTVYFNFNTPDSLITVRINGGKFGKDEDRTQWDFKVYCP